MKETPEIFGGLITGRPPLYSSDGKFLFCPSEFLIKVFSTKTGHLVQRLEGHSGRVSSVFLHPGNKMQIFSTSHDGTLRLWDYLDGRELESIDIGDKLPYFYPLSSKAYCEGVYAVPSKKSKENPKVKYYHLEVSQERKVTKRFVAKAPRPSAVALHASGKYLALAYDKEIQVVNIADLSMQVYQNDTRVTCLDFHPVTYELASGDASGKLKIWLLERSGKLVPSSEVRSTPHHWHSTRVMAVHYSADGYYIYTGGKEGVLVIWQLRFGRRDFLPRLGAPIVSIANSPNMQQLCIGLINNSFLLFHTGSKERECTIAALMSPAPGLLSHGLPRCTGIEPRTSAIVMNSREGSLQFYNPFLEKVESEVEVSTVNTQTTKSSRANAIQIDWVTFSSDGKVMVTMETLETEKDVHFWSSTLKIFDYSTQSSSYELHTLKDDPHTGKISGLHYHPGRDLVATCSHDKTFKLWSRLGEKSAKHRPWSLRSVGSFKTLPAGACRFSKDGSLLAVAFAGLITLWDPVANALVRTLASSQPKDMLTFVEFIPNSTHLVAHSKTALFVWDLLTCELLWSYNTNIVRIAVDSNNARFAFSTAEDGASSHLFLFESNKPSPLFTWKFRGPVQPLFVLSPPTNRHKLASLFPGLEPDRISSLACIDSKFRFFNLELETWPRTTAKHQETAPSVFSEIFGSDVLTLTPAVWEEETGKTTNSLFKAPVHVLPSVDVLFPLFISNLVVKQHAPTAASPILVQSETLPPETTTEDNHQHSVNTTNATISDLLFDKLRNFFGEKEAVPSSPAPAKPSQKKAVKTPKPVETSKPVEVEPTEVPPVEEETGKTLLRKAPKSAPSTPEFKATKKTVPGSAPARPKRKIEKT